MSKQQNVKISQGYIEKPLFPMCNNCKHMKADRTFPDPAWPGYCKEYDSCAIGDFRVKRQATCDYHEPK